MLPLDILLPYRKYFVVNVNFLEYEIMQLRQMESTLSVAEMLSLNLEGFVRISSVCLEKILKSLEANRSQH